MDKLKNPLVLLTVFFILVRTLNLTILPIFNDESIYLDWGLRELHEPGLLFYSLYDAKQPFLMWIFGIFQLLPFDPLFSGRLVSVLFGLLTAFGLYRIGQDLFDRKTGLIAFFFYSIIPIFSFYDRQALMEASIGAIGVWSFYLMHKGIELKKVKYFYPPSPRSAGLRRDFAPDEAQGKDTLAVRSREFYFLGIILGIGFFIKSSALILLLSAVVVFTIFDVKKKTYFKNLFYVFVSFFTITLLLLIQQQFWTSFHMNSRFSWSLGELFRFPIGPWVQNLFKNVEILFIYFTPVVFSGVIVGMVKMYMEKEKFKSLLLFLALTLFLETVLVKGTSQRYLVSFLPLFTLPVSYAFTILATKFNRYVIYTFFFSIPLLLTVLQVTNPILYFNIASKFSKNSEKSGYISSQPSGFATLAAVRYLSNISKDERIGVGVGVNTGNPESALMVYFDKGRNAKVFYLDSILTKGLDKLDCFESNIPIYFVSRDQQLVGLDKFLVNDRAFKNPYGENSVGVYKLKKCSGVKYKINI